MACSPTQSEVERSTAGKPVTAIDERLERPKLRVSRRPCVRALRPASPSPAAEGQSVLALVLETALDGVIVMRADGDVVDWNQQAEAKFGRRRDEAIGRPLAERVIPESLRAAHWAGLNRYFGTGKAILLERRLEVSAASSLARSFPSSFPFRPTTFTARPYSWALSETPPSVAKARSS